MSGKDELQKELNAAAKRFAEIYGGEVTVYAAAPKPDRKAWRRKPTAKDLAYQEALHEAEQSPPKK